MTARFLFDTNVISELARPKPHPGVVGFVATVSEVMVSSILFHELTFGLETAPPGQLRRLGAFIRAIRDRFEDRAVPIDVPIADAAARIRALAKRQGRTMTVADSLIAGTAIIHDATLVTRNIKDFDGLTLSLVNPFAGAEL